MKLGADDAFAVRDLYRSDSLVVRQVAANDRDRWVVTFDNYGIGHGFDRPGFGQAWLQSQNMSAIHVMGRAEDWYQYENIAEALEAVRTAVAGTSRVITYGSSMGGYAAIRFADAVGAHAALALSPQYTLDPEIAAHDGRWSQDVQRIFWLKAFSGPLKSRARIVLAYDPWGLDGWHGRRIGADVAAEAVRLPFTAHPVTSFLSEIGLLGELVVRVLDDTLDAPAFEREARRRRSTSGVYLGELAGLQPLHRQRLALALGRRAVDASPSNHHARLSLARLLLRGGEQDEALLLLEGLVADSNRAVTYLVDHGQALAMSGRTAEARVIVNEVLEQAGDVAHLHGWAAHTSWLNGDRQDARGLIRRALQLDPANPVYARAAAAYGLKNAASTAAGSSPWARVARWFERRWPRRTAQTEFRRTDSEPATGS
ncbi:MAG: alpha/beta hydrolase [Alphaproteobacteria bacterium]|nr:alpha/beta hydrolase [Alphaproteobacteria bacterium]MBU2378958.1 alpha/beta hydrolase [Alphaproteobacteria bacterium]